MKKNIIIVFLIVLSIGGIIVYLKKDNKENNPNEYKIVDKTVTCDLALEEIYRDKENIYYLSCMKSQNIYLEFNDGKSYLLKDALNDNMVDILEVINHGLDIIIKPIENDQNIEEMQKFLKDNGDDVLLTNLEIANKNQEIKSKSDMIYDLDNYNEISKEQIKKYISFYQMPDSIMYNNNKVIDDNEIKNILNNRNLEQINNWHNQKGIIVNRTNLRSFPTLIHFNKKDSTFDNIQETEVLVNTPLLILHESKDQLWYFVLTPTYYGWVLKEDIALVTEEDYEYFVKNEQFIIVTTKSVNVDKQILDMSVKLPLVGVNNDGYNVTLPRKGTDDYVVKTNVTISLDDAYIGYLPFTKNNIISQAFKYLNTPYSWGGMDNGVDCSSYISNIFRTFGFVFPRNTTEQKTSIGEVINLDKMNNTEKLSLIKENELNLLYEPGHVMLYLGTYDGKNYIIHANATNMEVAVTELNNLKLEKIDRIVKVID